MRSIASVLSPIPLLVGLAVALAPEIASAQGPQWAPPPAGELPDGIHYRNGRYFQDIGDHHAYRHFMSRLLLPATYRPGDVPVPETSNAGPGSGMAPSDVLAAYSIPPNTSAGGKIVAILDTPDSHAFADLTAYRAGYNLPALPKCTGLPTGTTPCFAQVNQSGGPSSGGDSGGNDGETSLDMDMISAACPDCSILLVEINALTNADILAGAKTAVALGAVATSISIGGPEATDPNPNCGGGGSDPTGYTTPGHLVLAASGDFGYLQGNQTCKSPSYPSSTNDVLSVGGTTLSSGTPYQEVTWNDQSLTNKQDATTSGCSTEFSQPSWQTALVAGTGCTKRVTADISAAAAFNNAAGQAAGISLYVNGQWQAAEGTSASSPLVAAILTRLGLTDQVAASFGYLYTNIAKFNDVTSGSDDSTGACTNLLCTAQAGWDGPTGVGTPNGAKIEGVECTSNANCTSPKPVCKTPPGSCVGCLTNTDCSGLTPVCNTTTNTCQACSADTDCASPTPHCATGSSDPNKGKCVACTSNAQCSGSTPICANDVCDPCTMSSQCPASAPVCDSTGACVPGAMPDAGGTGGTGGTAGTGGHGGTGGTSGDAGPGPMSQETSSGSSGGCSTTDTGSSSPGLLIGIVVGLAAIAGAKRKNRR